MYSSYSWWNHIIRSHFSHSPSCTKILQRLFHLLLGKKKKNLISFSNSDGDLSLIPHFLLRRSLLLFANLFQTQNTNARPQKILPQRHRLQNPSSRHRRLCCRRCSARSGDNEHREVREIEASRGIRGAETPRNRPEEVRHRPCRPPGRDWKGHHQLPRRQGPLV